MSAPTNAHQERVLTRLKALGRKAGVTELHKGVKGHQSSTRDALVALRKAGLIKRIGAGRSTGYVLATKNGTNGHAKGATAARGGAAGAARGGEPRWIILIDGEALIVEAGHVAVIRERVS